MATRLERGGIATCERGGGGEGEGKSEREKEKTTSLPLLFLHTYPCCCRSSIRRRRIYVAEFLLHFGSSTTTGLLFVRRGEKVKHCLLG